MPKYDDKIIYIHGELNNKSNPIIFGYGDESDVYYEKIERLNINEFTRNFKSFHYYNTDNYKNLFNSLDDKYEIIIMGHSCGISDRVLLKELFTSNECQAIKIYHHKKNDGSNDYITKTQEISRHFPSNKKHKMRLMIENLGPLT